MAKVSRARRILLLPDAPARTSRTSAFQTATLAVLLVAACLAVFAPVRHFDFVSWDDGQYVTQNPNVVSGLTGPGVWWALTASGGYYWHPLTWLSHMLDVQLYGLAPGAHHLTGLLLHVLATLLLFGALRRLTGDTLPSAVAAGLFALHPLHVESVAWIAERKDVLSAVFWMATLWAYARFAEQPRPRRYLLVVMLFACGLMAKPMVVMLPAVLLLLDVWPLARLSLDSMPAARANLRALVYEKLPLVAMSAASAAITFAGQASGGAVRSTARIPVVLRVENALVSTITYLGKTLWPSGLAAYYPYPRAMPGWKAWSAAAVLLALSFGVWQARRTRPYLLVGWLWFLLTLVPVIGLVQVGDQAMADRFTYLPLVGIFMAAVWAANDAARGRPRVQVALAGCAGLVLVCCGVAARQQVQFWQDSASLWTRAAAVTRDNERAHANLAALLEQQGRRPEAAEHYAEAARILALDAQAAGVAPVAAAVMHNQAGILLMQERRVPDATREFAAAVGQKPADPDYRHNLAVALDEQGRGAEAVAEHLEVARLRPAHAPSRNEACLALARAGRTSDAIPECREALRLDPAQPTWHYNVALMLLDSGAEGDAVAHLREALRLDPGFEQARAQLARLTKHDAK